MAVLFLTCLRAPPPSVCAGCPAISLFFNGMGKKKTRKTFFGQAFGLGYVLVGWLLWPFPVFHVLFILRFPKPHGPFLMFPFFVVVCCSCARFLRLSSYIRSFPPHHRHDGLLLPMHPQLGDRRGWTAREVHIARAARLQLDLLAVWPGMMMKKWVNVS